MPAVDHPTVEPEFYEGDSPAAEFTEDVTGDNADHSGGPVIPVRVVDVVPVRPQSPLTLTTQAFTLDGVNPTRIASEMPNRERMLVTHNSGAVSVFVSPVGPLAQSDGWRIPPQGSAEFRAKSELWAWAGAAGVKVIIAQEFRD